MNYIIIVACRYTAGIVFFCNKIAEILFLTAGLQNKQVILKVLPE